MLYAGLRVRIYQIKHAGAGSVALPGTRWIATIRILPYQHRLCNMRKVQSAGKKKDGSGQNRAVLIHKEKANPALV
jgi:hypothetical protein